MLAAWSQHKFVFRAINIIANDNSEIHSGFLCSPWWDLGCSEVARLLQQLHQKLEVTEECYAVLVTGFSKCCKISIDGVCLHSYMFSLSPSSLSSSTTTATVPRNEKSPPNNVLLLLRRCALPTRNHRNKLTEADTLQIVLKVNVSNLSQVFYPT